MAKSNQSDKDWQAALKAVEAFDKKIKDTEKSAQRVKGVFSNIATELFGISGSAFFEETKLSIDEIIQKEKELAKVTNDLNSVNKKITDDMRGAFGGLESGLKNISKTMSNDVSKALNSIKFADAKDIAHLSQVNKLLEDENLTAQEKKKLQELQKAYIKDNLDYQEKNKQFIEDELKKYPDFMKHASEKDRLQAASIIAQGGFNELVERELDLSGKVLRLSTKNNGEASAFSEIQMENQIIAGEMVKSVGAINDELKKGTKEAFTLKKGFEEISKNFAAGIIPKVLEFDQAISDAGKDFGFIQDMSVGTAVQMANLNMEAARFGMSAKDTLQMMGDLGDELKTIDQKYLAESVGHFVAIQKATGISSQELTTIAGEMMRAGKSAEQVEGYMEGANKTAKMFGVNTKKILQGVAKNIDKMRQMGFQGGEESLTRMAARAERLNMNMDEMFDVAKRARSIEGAMEMASELQLAGGSFANIDPMSLLAAARKGPEELQKILTQMGGDIGDFNDKGEFVFDAVDTDRLQMVADATGQSLDSIQKGIQTAAKTNQKLDLLGLSGSIDDDSRNFIADLTKVGKDGKTIEMDPELSKLAEGAGISLEGVDDLGDLNQEQITALMEAKKADTASLEEQAEQNQSFTESITALKDAFINIFTVFEPLIKILTEVVQWLNGSAAGKWVVGIAALAFIAIPKLIGAFGGFKESVSSITDSFKGMKEGKGFLGKIKGAFTGATPEDKGDLPGLKDSKDQTPGGGKGGLQSLKDGLKAMGTDFKDVLKGIAAVALAGPALVLLLPGIPTLLAMAGIGALGKLVSDGFKYTAKGIGMMGKNLKEVALGSVAMLLIGASLIPFAFALGMMADVSWKAVVAGLGFLLISAGIIIALGAIMTSGVGAVAILLGAAAMIVIAGAVLVFAVALNTMVPAAEALSSIGFSWLFDLGMALLMASPGLLLGGLALLVATPGLIMGSVGLMAFAQAATLLNEIDWTAFASIGDALLGLVPGLLGFSLAGLMFANPITLLGMLMMIGNLGMLATIITPLAESLNTGADGLDRFASGLEKLQAAANSLDFERLEALKDLSMSLAVGSSGGGMGDELAKIAEAIVKISGNSGGGTGGGNRKIEIDLKLNGRQIKEMIIDDTEIVS